jgi:hypothetical protein
MLDLVGRMSRNEDYYRMLEDQRQLQGTEAEFLSAAPQRELADFVAHYGLLLKRAVAWEAANWRTIKREYQTTIRQDEALRAVMHMNGVKFDFRPVSTRAGVSVTPRTLEWFKEAQGNSPNSVIVKALNIALLST